MLALEQGISSLLVVVKLVLSVGIAVIGSVRQRALTYPNPHEGLITSLCRTQLLDLVPVAVTSPALQT